ncbi:Uncharacterised protein [Streptococcus pyogenes]|nr:hypothetical protein Z339_00459 [Streptococcus pyogenes ABC020030925]VGX48963.1 Uncharacterised protein [Streptococcus pyogenes]VGX66001.1 Uncharacterised protein [Streptococcus pyogenes]VGX83351.1 Uncharacterised protein [Streptococcus pyogenes]VGX84775.1 Uncharacterised protein [Streptococcus pyogenes]
MNYIRKGRKTQYIVLSIYKKTQHIEVWIIYEEKTRQNSH